jgi:hypothetical protein
VVGGADAVAISTPRPAARPKAAPRPVPVHERESFPLPVPIALPPIHGAMSKAPAVPSATKSVAMVVLCLAAYLVAISLAAVAAWFSIHGMIVLFPGAPTAIVAMGVAMEVGKLVSVAFLAHQWRRLGLLSRTVLIVLVAGLAAMRQRYQCAAAARMRRLPFGLIEAIAFVDAVAHQAVEVAVRDRRSSVGGRWFWAANRREGAKPNQMLCSQKAAR